MVRRRVIEELRERKTDFVEPCPIQIAKDDSLFCFLLRGFHEAHLGAKIFPCLAIVNYAIDPGPELWIHRLTKFALPPEIERQIRIQVRENDAW